MKTVAALIALAGLAGVANAAITVSEWDFLGQPGNQVTNPGIGSANATATDMSRGVGLTASAGSNSFSATGFTGETTDYFAFGFTMDTGFQVDLESLYIGTRSSNTGPGTLGLYYNGDGFAAPVHTFNQSPGTNFVNSIVDLTSLPNLSGLVEFRIAAIGSTSANGGSTSAAGAFRVTGYFAGGVFERNLQFTGNVIPAPASVALLGLAGLVAGRRRR